MKRLIPDAMYDPEDAPQDSAEIDRGFDQAVDDMLTAKKHEEEVEEAVSHAVAGTAKNAHDIIEETKKNKALIESAGRILTEVHVGYFTSDGLDAHKEVVSINRTEEGAKAEIQKHHDEYYQRRKNQSPEYISPRARWFVEEVKLGE